MSTPAALAEPPAQQQSAWPKDAVPEHWITELFKRMHRMWGNAFLDKWRDVEMDGLKTEWAKALKKLSSTELKAGVDALLTLKFPPSLPEFYGLCKQMRLHEMPRAEALTDQTRADAGTVHANVSRMREALGPMQRSPEPTAEWAYRLLMRGESASGKQLTFEVIRCASDAISSSAGRKVVEDCTDDFQRENYRTIREAVIDGYRASNKPLWETV
ncbi:hypothetical protein BCh11DRAFT_06456 [Burkholderia sp. Ch1-1]|nr:hypothetical protein BCh11DRAFT_06456 [Burkholderia sp. Ch1-1]